MIKKQLFKERNDGIKLFKRYSLEGFLIKKKGTDELYDEAIDVEDADFEYEETEGKIEEEEEADGEK